MRNVPPETANYIQRAGRAGRRTDSTAYSLTYAKRRSHDLNYFQYPKEIIAGKIRPPYIEKNNDKIVQRHLYSVVFAWFFKRNKEFFGSVDDFFCYTRNSQNAINVLRNELANRPEDLLSALKIVIPQQMHSYFELETWGWVDKLLNEKEGALIIAQGWLDDVLKDLKELRNKLIVDGKPSDNILRITNTYLGRRILDFLSSNNILPKYGFPVDVVELALMHHGNEAQNISLSRDLKMAISEFAPGSEIVANGKVWSPYAVNKSSTKGWPVYEYTICPKCKKIYKYEADLGVNIEGKIPECCGEQLDYHKYIKPVFGFSTNIDPPKEPGEKRIVKSFPTQVIFDSFVDNESNLTDKIEDNIKVGSVEISYKYSSRGRLVLLNQGPNKKGFQLCKSCGYVTNSHEKTLEKHKTKMGNTCYSTIFIISILGTTLLPMF